MTRRRWLVVLVAVGLAALLAQFHHRNINTGPKSDKRADRHLRILEKRGDAPWTYRVAVPFVVEGISRAVIAAGGSERHTRERVYSVLRFVFTAIGLILFHRLLEQWLSLPPPYPLLGMVWLGAVHGPSYAWYWFQPASAADLVVWLSVALATVQRRDVWLFPLLLLGAFNRETAVFAVLIHAALRWGDEPVRATVLRCLGLGAVWAAGFVGVRLWIGEVGWAHGGTPLGYLRANLNGTWLLYMISIWGVLWAIPLVAWKRSPDALKRLFVALLPYLVLQLLFGRVREIRLFVPLAIVLVPMALVWLQSVVRDEQAMPGAR